MIFSIVSITGFCEECFESVQTTLEGPARVGFDVANIREHSTSSARNTTCTADYADLCSSATSPPLTGTEKLVATIETSWQ
ncbi:hypothetical protein LZ554_001874 [Drepanopeziza brunnea f. sp. 'monogermtubi']|nr:hypothetical protein LZ554_001874 [Drepanopeziza brunnea f. sp. 'monogermtubi']